jgi:protein-disulfide isomerase
MKQSFLLLFAARLVLACGGALSPQAAGGDVAVKAAPERGAARAALPAEDDAPVPIAADDPASGSRTALVTVVVFSDFQCPFCARGADTLNTLRARYGADELRVVFKHAPLPFHESARPAAEIGQGVFELGGSTAFWRFYDLVFASQDEMSLPRLLAWAEEAGADRAAIEAGIRTRRWEKKVDRDLELASALDVNGTPTFFVNGVKLVGAKPARTFGMILDAELQAAKELVRAGTPRERVYVEASTRNGPKPQRKTVADAPAAPAMGAEGAKVTIFEFADFQCPYCARVRRTLEELVRAYPNDVRVVWRNMPLASHDEAELAAEAAQEAFAQKGNEGFWKMNALIFEGQRVPGIDRPALEGYAKAIGLDLARFGRALDTHEHRATLEADAQAAKEAGIDVVPAFVINGYYMTGAQPLPKFRRLVERALAEAK